MNTAQVAPRLRFRLVLALVLAGPCAHFLSACEKAGVEESRVPKESSPPAVAEPPAAPSAVPGIEAAGVPQASPASQAPQASAPGAWPWQAPESWRLVPGERPMRLATYEMQGPSGPVEVAISRFPGDVGGMLANVNRWRGQVGLPPASEADLAGMIEPFETPGFKGSLLHIQGVEQHIVVASIFEAGANQTWTVRVSAPPAIAEAVKPEIFAFARTFGVAK